ncbi:hypothetical protein YA0089_25960 [Pseudomonas viridiflava]|uniref:hypothetical protein n=1 Tax=Pseudomonas viridiflava TaxID=33069 RepID=UPI0018E617D5|nr:hypothetical protein [Pseudomonas viridiflava]MBI6727061.1 hypothetical protein [Pseudomonas viridiflava]
MSKELLWQAGISVKNENLDGLNRSLAGIKELAPDAKNAYIAELATNAMLGSWTRGLDAVLMAVGKDAFPNESLRDGIHYYTIPLDHSKANELVNLFRIHQERLSPEVKADMAFQMLPYMNKDLISKVEALGLCNLKDLEGSYRPTIHGAMSRHGGDGAKMAEILKLAPEAVREFVYAKVAKEPMPNFYSASFVDGIKNDPVYQRVTTPAVELSSFEQSSFEVNPNSSFEPSEAKPDRQMKNDTGFNMS